MPQMYWIGLLIFIWPLACRAEMAGQNSNIPLWLNQKISNASSSHDPHDANLKNPQAIYSYTYKGQQVFYVVAPCCDLLNSLFDEKGNKICAPDGGITGKGDRQCPDFRNEAKNERILYTASQHQ